MKLILTQEVSGLGAPGEVVEVKDGYGRNYLVPRGFAMRWTRGAEKQIDSITQARGAREIRGIEQAKAVRGELERLKVRLRTRAGDSGRLFGAVTPADIAGAVKAAGGPQLDKRRIEIDQPDQDGRRPQRRRPPPPGGQRQNRPRGHWRVVQVCSRGPGPLWTRPFASSGRPGRRAGQARRRPPARATTASRGRA